jgi:hypothetical protein
MSEMRLPILTLNSHEAWVHQLGYLGVPVHIVDGLPGRYCRSWDTHVRPVPTNAKLIALHEVATTGHNYDCIVAHSVTDLMAVKYCDAPRILMIHSTLEGTCRNQGVSVPLGFADAAHKYLELVGGYAVAVTPLKGHSWGFVDEVVPCAVNVDDYLPYAGSVAAGIRVSNQINARRDYLHWDFHEQAFTDIPVRIVGHNPDMPGSEPSKSWDDLKHLLSEHRFFIHTADPALEDGYNMATLEAMAAGLPVLSNRHPTSLVVHGVNGFVADTPAELRGFALRLLGDRELSAKMGQAARQTVCERFSMVHFVKSFNRSIESAKQRYWEQPHQAFGGEGAIRS